MSRLRFLPIGLAAGLLFALAPLGAAAAEFESFSEERFRALQEEGALVLVDVFADWCPTCAKQEKVLERYFEERPDVPLHVLRVDFDDQKEWVTHFGAPRQSTFVLFRGEEKLWFSVSETDAEKIFAELDEAAGR